MQGRGGQVFKYDSEKPAFARAASSSSSSSSKTPSLAEQYPDMVQYLESIETQERIKYYPHLIERAPNVEIDDVQRDVIIANDEIGIVANDIDKDNGDYPSSNERVASLRHEGLREFTLQLLTTFKPSNYINIQTLDVSHNELDTLPGISELVNLEILCIKRNWFNVLPSGIGKLHKLKFIDASRNFLKPNADSLQLMELKNLTQLKLLDVSLNQKCRTADHRAYIKTFLLPLTNVKVTVWQEASNDGENNCIGSSAAQRNAILLRSQLEPWGTVNLRRRLVRDFDCEPTDPRLVDRAEVMKRLLSCYRKEGMLYFDNNNSEDLDLNHGLGKRQIIKVDGTPVRKELLDEILNELRHWRFNNKRGGSKTNRERPSIKADCYMILRAPKVVDSRASKACDALEQGGEKSTSRREKRRHKKMEGNTRLWQLAMQAMQETDQEFASKCSEIAVTFGFTGSPHIDRQNSSPFHGLSLGNFTEGTGCVAVECSPRIVAHVNTKNRIGRVDGRYPHWVTSYDVNEERFSLIYYDTLSAYEPPGPAIFTVPRS